MEQTLTRNQTRDILRRGIGNFASNYGGRTVDFAPQSAERFTRVHPDFGIEVSVVNAIVSEKYRASRPMPITIYRNDDGYTAVVNDFERILGYGDTAEEAVEEAQAHLVNIRARYGRLNDDSGTPEALVLRDKLTRYLKEV